MWPVPRRYWSIPKCSTSEPEAFSMKELVGRSVSCSYCGDELDHLAKR